MRLGLSALFFQLNFESGCRINDKKRISFFSVSTRSNDVRLGHDLTPTVDSEWPLMAAG